MLTDAEARQRLLKILDDARTFDELHAAVVAAAASDPNDLFGRALHFVTADDATGLAWAVRERFAQVLSRFVESRRALHLAGVLEAGEAGASPSER